MSTADTVDCRHDGARRSVQTEGLPPQRPDAAPDGQVDDAEQRAVLEHVLELQIPGADVHRGLAGPVVRDGPEQVAEEGQRQRRQHAGHACNREIAAAQASCYMNTRAQVHVRVARTG